MVGVGGLMLFQWEGVAHDGGLCSLHSIQPPQHKAPVLYSSGSLTTVAYGPQLL